MIPDPWPLTYCTAETEGTKRRMWWISKLG